MENGNAVAIGKPGSAKTASTKRKQAATPRTGTTGDQPAPARQLQDERELQPLPERPSIISDPQVSQLRRIFERVRLLLDLDLAGRGPQDGRQPIRLDGTAT